MDTAAFGRIAAQSAKQVIIQKMKDAERDAVFSNFIERKGEIINGIVQRFDRNDIIVNLGQTEGTMPLREQIPKESYRQIVLSRTHPNFLISLFKTEVPEIGEGIVLIKDAAREPGSRAKIAVSSTDSDIDPVGACVGMKGSRVQNVVQELRGEKIDIISWHVDPAKYVCNALSPAEISRVIIDEENHAMEIIVPDESLSVAIGKRGQNVKLASKLTGWRLDVKSASSYDQTLKSGYASLMELPGMSQNLVYKLAASGYYSTLELRRATVDDLVEITGLTPEQAQSFIEAAAASPVEESAPEEKSAEGENAADSEAPKTEES